MARKSLFADAPAAPLQTASYDIDSHRARLVEQANQEARRYLGEHVAGREAWLQAKGGLRFGNPGTDWATRIVEREKSGEMVSMVALQMARKALGTDKWEEQDC